MTMQASSDNRGQPTCMSAAAAYAWMMCPPHHHFTWMHHSCVQRTVHVSMLAGSVSCPRHGPGQAIPPHAGPQQSWSGHYPTCRATGCDEAAALLPTDMLLQHEMLTLVLPHATATLFMPNHLKLQAGRLGGFGGALCAGPTAAQLFLLRQTLMDQL